MNTDPVKTLVHVSRHWDNPAINVRVYREGIEIEISLDDFCSAIVDEIGHPAFTFSREKLRASVLDAVDIVLDKVKQSSNYV